MNYRQTSAGELAAKLAELSGSLARCCTAKEAECFERFGLTAAEGQMLLLVCGAGAMQPSAVADSLGVGRSRITPLAESLVKQGLLMRTESRTDRRQKSLSASARGEEIAQKAAAYRLKFHTQLIECFGERERNALLDSLGKLRDAMLEVRQEMRSAAV